MYGARMASLRNRDGVVLTEGGDDKLVLVNCSEDYADVKTIVDPFLWWSLYNIK